jgi:hypothetical protein
MRGYAYQLMAISTFTSWTWLHRIAHRTLIVHGRDDPVSPSLNARLMMATMPDAQLHMVAGGGHLLLLDEPGRVAPGIVDFLESGARTTVSAPARLRRRLTHEADLLLWLCMIDHALSRETA